MDKELTESSLRALRSWVESAGWAGHDPFDVRSHPFYLTCARRARDGDVLSRLALGLLYRFERRAPFAARRLLHTSPMLIPKGMGLFARAYLFLARNGDAAAAAEAGRRLDWLSANARANPGTSWGYPFDWQSRVFIPAGTPSSVVTATVADAYRERYARHGRGADELQNAARFIERGLSRSYDSPEALCFSYTPIDRMAVHNANLLAAELLLWAGHTFDEPDWRSLATRAFTYTLRHQREDGAWDYWGPPEAGHSPPHIDPYHTGFVLRMLLRAHHTTGEDRYLDAARRGYEYFTRTLLEDGVPKHTDRRRHPVDGHAVAETLLAFLACRGFDTTAPARAEKLLRWANVHMRDPKGFYYYLWSPRQINRLPMMRWVQAWMFLALAAWLVEEPTP